MVAHEFRRQEIRLQNLITSMKVSLVEAYTQEGMQLAVADVRAEALMRSLFAMEWAKMHNLLDIPSAVVAAVANEDVHGRG
jgi:hypothetical protein